MWAALQPLRLIYWLIKRFPQPQTTPAVCRDREGGGHMAARAAGRPAGALRWLRGTKWLKEQYKGAGSGSGPRS